MQAPVRCSWYWVDHLVADGIAQMAMDEALLEWVQTVHAGTPVLVARTYQWLTPTLSLGTHQKGEDARRAYRHYSAKHRIDLVRRPTGGRAILHGEDVSFAFVTNVPLLLHMSLDESYCHFTTWVRHALKACGVPLETACTPDKRDYMRSPLCFETKTPSDLQTATGQKVAGSAQLRRQGGILQHGAAFLQPFAIEPMAFDAALRQAIEATQGNKPITLNPMEEPALAPLWQHYRTVQADAVDTIRAMLATTSGSHLVPDSA